VQEQYDLQNGAALRLTVARYYTPNGRSIQRPYNKNRDNYFIEQAIDDSTRQGGIVPDFRVNTDAMKWSDSLANVRIFERLREWSYRYVQTHPTLNKGKSDTTNRVENINIQPSDWQQALSLRISDTVTAYLNQYVKALVGRMLAGNGAFFSIMNQQDPFVKAGLNTLKD